MLVVVSLCCRFGGTGGGTIRRRDGGAVPGPLRRFRGRLSVQYTWSEMIRADQ